MQAVLTCDSTCFFACAVVDRLWKKIRRLVEDDRTAAQALHVSNCKGSALVLAAWASIRTQIKAQMMLLWLLGDYVFSSPWRAPPVVALFMSAAAGCDGVRLHHTLCI
jgi:hypothetical protein